MTDHLSQTEQQQMLAKVDLLAQLPPEEVERVVLRSTSLRLGKKETFAPAEDSRSILLLLSGRVRVHEPSAAGPDITISWVEGGTVVGQTGFAVRLSRTLRVEALQPSTLQVLGWEDFEDLVFRYPKVGMKTIRLLSERLAMCEGRLSDLVRKEVPARLAGVILRFSEHQGVVTGEGYRIIPNRYTHQQLASMVGSNREAVTRAFGKLRKMGAVEIRDRHIHVTDADMLERLAGTGQ